MLLIVMLGQLYRYKIDEHNHFLRVPKELKVINLGSSHGQYGFKYPKDFKGYNLGVSSQPFYYDLMVLEKYKNNLSENSIVIIPVSIFSFYRGYEIGDLNDKYYSFLDYLQLYKGEKNPYILKKYFPLLFNGKTILSVGKYFFTNIIKGDFSPREVVYPRNLTLEEKIAEADKTSTRHMGLDDEKFTQSSEIGINQLKEILELCKNNNLKPILLSTPQSYLYNERVGERGYQERIYNNLKKINEVFGEEIKYLDYSHDERFEKNLELFSDDDHLNENGAEKFTNIVLEDLKKEGLL